MREFTRVSIQGSSTGVLIEKEHESNRPTGYFHNSLCEEGNADMDKSLALPLRASQSKKR